MYKCWNYHQKRNSVGNSRRIDKTSQMLWRSDANRMKIATTIKSSQTNRSEKPRETNTSHWVNQHHLQSLEIICCRIWNRRSNFIFPSYIILHHRKMQICNTSKTADTNQLPAEIRHRLSKTRRVFVVCQHPPAFIKAITPLTHPPFLSHSPSPPPLSHSPLISFIHLLHSNTFSPPPCTFSTYHPLKARHLSSSPHNSFQDISMLLSFSYSNSDWRKKCQIWTSCVWASGLDSVEIFEEIAELKFEM